MSVIDDYLKKIETSKRKELQRIRELAKEIVPTAEETISYGMPTLKYAGKPFLGFDAHKANISIYPYSGDVVPKLKKELADYRGTKSAIHIPFDRPIPKALLKKVIDVRLKAIKAAKKTS